MMDNATDSRITAHLLSTAHYVAACNALLFFVVARTDGRTPAPAIAGCQVCVRHRVLSL